ncbi:GNAT family N-acetyltransferase [Streptomyces kaniharaensis]|uniref:GNAT family N-acetyltransferase n=1 Tax=Streptomyces kaniharaensis TaxID=212423 RepID=A0A6N7KZ46_9ACTN|nr:GNAT family N-acetyltransferase [Streptomyces kaniharaensis]MQS15637.1 GNAT family N-acetyltransferase [Streptomyces kaniharaensis]
MRITECEQTDVALLEEHLPSRGRSSFHARRFARQLAGSSTYLIAWEDERPAGAAEVRWNGCAAAEVQRALPECPEINALHVAEPLQGRGIGTALIRHAERLAARRGVPRIGLGVAEEGNPRAAALYARLGYRPVVRYLDRWSYVDDRGEVHDVEDPCVFLAKGLAAAAR